MSDKFIWSKDDANMNTTQIFPIDYTNKEFSELITSNEKRVKSIILESPILSPILRDLLFNCRPEDVPPESSAISSPLPFEAGMFLKNFLLLADERRKNYRKLVKEGSKSTSKSSPPKFFSELSRNLYQQSESDLSQENPAMCQFYRHALFRHNGFASAMLNILWKEEIEHRFQKLQKLAKDTPPDFQMTILVNCLVALDCNILNLALWSTNSPGTPEALSEVADIQEMLRNLLSYRQKVPSKNVYATYSINNCSLPDNSTLEEAFNRLKKKSPAAELRETARTAYIANLEQISNQRSTEEAKKAGILEKRFVQVKEYLDLTSSQMNEEKLGEIVIECCKKECQHLIDQCTYNPTAIKTGAPFDQTYRSDMIGYLARSYMSQKLDIWNNTFQVVRFYNAAQVGSRGQAQYIMDHLSMVEQISGQTGAVEALFEGTLRNLAKPTENPFYQHLLMLENFFQQTWSFIQVKNNHIFSPDTHKFNCKDEVANQLLSSCRAAAHFFERDELNFQTKDDVAGWLTLYEMLIADPCSFYSPHKYIGVISRLMSALLLLILHRVALDAKRDVVGHIQKFLSLIQDQ